MGNDGGSIPTRRELVKEAARNPTATELKEARLEQQDHHWNTDALSQKPLERPVVSDALGRLFNKESVIEFLLGSSPNAEEANKIVNGSFKGLKDVLELKFEVDSSEEAKKSRVGQVRKERWICPVTRKELGPTVKAVYLVPCAHVLSDTAVKQILERRCPQCDSEYAENDAIPILPTSEEDIARLTLRRRTLAEKGLTHSLKKAAGSKKKRKESEKDDAPNGAIKNVSSSHVEANGSSGSKEPSRTSTPPPKTANTSASINNAATASLTARVLEEERAKRRKVEANDNLTSLYTQKEKLGARGKNHDFMTRGFTVPKT